MICLIALVVFGLLSVFSVKYRIIAKEAFDCVFKRMTLRKCTTGLDKRLKGQITGNLMKHSPSLGRLIYKNFEIISWTFTILMIASIAQSGISIYNYIEYGNCNGPTNEGFCIFDPLAGQQVSACGEGGSASTSPKPLLAPQDTSRFNTFGNADSKVKLVMFGCYTCPYTKKSASVIFDIYAEYKDRIEFVFIDFPILSHNNSFLAAVAAQCVFSQDKDAFLDYTKRLYADEDITEESLRADAASSGIDMNKFDFCLKNETYKSFVEESIRLGHESGVFGTPTFFINEKHIVGPTTKKSFEKLIDDELNK